MAQSPYSKSSQSPAGTHIGEGLTIEGELTSEEAITIAGVVKGKVTSTEEVVIERSGAVEADLETRSTTVHGTLTGNLTATEKVELSSQARLIGDVRSARISIAEGAAFKGHIDMDV